MAAIDPDRIAELAHRLVEHAHALQLALLVLLTSRLKRDLDSEQWAARRSVEIGEVERRARRLIEKARKDRNAEVLAAVIAAWELTRRRTLRLVRTLRIEATQATLRTPDEAAIRALANDLAGRLDASDARILRSTMDAYRKVIGRATMEGLLGEHTRRSVAQAALDDFADRGITGFIDSAGRSWNLASYTEMAVRTAALNASRQGVVDGCRAAGRDLVVVGGSSSSCPECAPWEGEVLSLDGASPGYPTLAEAEAAGLFHPNCVAGESLILGPPVVAATARWYEGEVVVLEATSGDELVVTPNHPVLTTEGWVAAGALHKGDNVIRYLGDERVMQGVRPDDEHVPATIQDVTSALLQAFPMTTMGMPVSAEDFHGDGVGGEVDVVLVNGLLGDRGDTALEQPSGEQTFGDRDVRNALLLTDCATTQVVIGALHAAHSGMSSSSVGRSFCLRHASGSSARGIGSANSGATLAHPAAHRSLAHTELFSDRLLRLPGAVEADALVNIGRREFADYVYNLQTRDGWFASNRIVLHNCGHRIDPFIEGLTDASFVQHGDPERYEAREQQRYLERGVRRWKAREAAALDDVARARAAARVREWQGRLREHIETHGLKRLPYREQINKAI